MIVNEIGWVSNVVKYAYIPIEVDTDQIYLLFYKATNYKKKTIAHNRID